MNRVQFVWRRRPTKPAADRLRAVATGVLARQGMDGVELGVVIGDDALMRELNRQYRKVDRSTDVLSFPDGETMPDGTTLLGEIVISLESARRQARELGHGEVRELEELVLHGVLHLLGHDHEMDGGAMNALELELREELLP
jgi:probable rRNA maturation factor